MIDFMRTHTRKCEDCAKLFDVSGKERYHHTWSCPSCREAPKVIDPRDYETVKITGIGRPPSYAMRRNPVKR